MISTIVCGRDLRGGTMRAVNSPPQIVPRGRARCRIVSSCIVVLLLKVAAVFGSVISAWAMICALERTRAFDFMDTSGLCDSRQGRHRTP